MILVESAVRAGIDRISVVSGHLRVVVREECQIFHVEVMVSPLFESSVCTMVRECAEGLDRWVGLDDAGLCEA